MWVAKDADTPSPASQSSDASHTKQVCMELKPNLKSAAVLGEEQCVKQDKIMAVAEQPKISSSDLTGDQFVESLGLVLTRWVEATAQAGEQQKATQFHSSRLPGLHIRDYLQRIHRYFFCSDECYVMALVYIDRVGKVDPSAVVSELNVHRLLVTAVMLAAKFLDDVYYSNAYYAKVGGLRVKEINVLESKLLQLLKWSVNVQPEEYQLYFTAVSQAARPPTPASPMGMRKEPEPEPCSRETQ
jgi:hypothetical protein